MSKEIKRKKKLNKREEYDFARNRENERLLESYKEGVSNVDWDQFDSSHAIWASIGAEPRDLPLIPQEIWLERKLEEWEENRTKVPPGKVQDPAGVVVKYKRKFLEAIRRLEPQVLLDLQPLGPIFSRLLRNQTGDSYIKIFNDLQVGLVEHRLLERDSSYKIDFDYVWGELSKTTRLAGERHRSTLAEGSQVPESLNQLTEADFRQLDVFDQTITEVFGEVAEKPEVILPLFFSFQTAIYDWAEKYNLRKDWLFEYAYYLISQYSQNENLTPGELVLGQKVYSSNTLYSPFEFKTEGWWAAEEGETAIQYKKRVTQEFNSKLDDYMLEASRFLRLDKLKMITKPLTFDRLDWLVCWTVKGWDAERIVDYFFREIGAARTTKNGSKAFESKKKHIEIEIRKLELFDLPIRNKS